MSDVRYLQMIERDANGNMLSTPTLVKFNKNGQVIDSHPYNLPDDTASKYMPSEFGNNSLTARMQSPQQFGMRFLPAPTGTQPVLVADSGVSVDNEQEDQPMQENGDDDVAAAAATASSWMEKIPIVAWAWRSLKNTPLVFAIISMLVNSWMLVYSLLWLILRYYAWSSDDARRASTLFDLTMGLTVWSLFPIMAYQLYVFIHKSIQYFVYHKFVVENVAEFKLSAMGDSSSSMVRKIMYPPTNKKSSRKQKKYVHKVIMKDSFDVGAHIMWIASRVSGTNAFFWSWLVVSMTKGNRYLLKLVFRAVMMGFLTIWVMNVYNVFMTNPNALGIESLRYSEFIGPTYNWFQTHWNDAYTYLWSPLAPINPGAPAAATTPIINLSSPPSTTPYYTSSPGFVPGGPPTVSLRGGIL